MRHLHSVRATSAIAVGAGMLASAAGQVNGPAVQVEATPRSAVVPQFRIEAMLADEWIRPAMHPPIDTIPAMPMPGENGADAGDPTAGPGYAVVYDQRTGLEAFYPVIGGANGSVAHSAYNGADGAQSYEDIFGTRSFGTMTQVAESAFPWRMNTKLVIEYVDSVTGTPSYFVCSGGMNDAEVVLTAAHCVYNRDNDSSGNDFGFADRIWVYPGWDGAGIANGVPGVIDNYGWAQSEYLGAFTGYTQNGNRDWDVGLIRVSRAVGMLTGWYALAWDGNCSFIQGQTYNVGSYPAEACGTTGLHNGRDQLYWFGSYDNCTGTNDAQLFLNTTPGCFTAQWGGMSGGNSYYIDGDTRFAHAVVSNSNNATFANHTKVWGAFATFLETQEGVARGTSFDLQALQYRATPTTIVAGNATATARVNLANATNANPGSASYGLRTFLSTNNNISPSDTLLNDVSFSFDFAPMQNLDLGSGNVTIPKNTPSGTYWLGIELDAGVDSDNSNNDTDLWDAQEITVTGIADIVANSCTVPNGSVVQGDTLNIAYSVSNEGGDPSNSVTLTFYASTNTDISAFDTELGTTNIGTFTGSQTKTGSVNLTVPETLNGTYYIGYIASASDDSIVNVENEAFDSVAIDIQGRSDLRAEFINNLDARTGPGGVFGLQYRVGNIGDEASGPYTVDFYASTNSFISVSDTLISTTVRPGLLPGAAITQNRNILLPLALSPGDYYIGMIVGNGVNETATQNNSAFDNDTLRIADCPVDFNNDGIQDLSDINSFVGAFVNQDSLADIDENGIFDLTDITTFVDLFVTGCP